MPPEARDPAALWDMLRAARAIVSFAGSLSLDAYRANPLVRRAVERELEILGEAARRVSDTTRARHDGIPWQQIVGLRNVLAHQYDEIDDERVWRLAKDDVPRLVRQLEPLVPDTPNEQPQNP
jgi:uncharacterized protein with HEPN domain